MATTTKAVWNADKPKICGIEPVRIVLGRADDNQSFIEAHATEFVGKTERMRRHYVCYYLNEGEIKRLYDALKQYYNE
jgi:hypothetical protein